MAYQNSQLAGEMYIQKRKEDVPKFCRFLGFPCDSGCQLLQRRNGRLRTRRRRNSERSGQAACAVALPSAAEHRTAQAIKTRAAYISLRSDDTNDYIKFYASSSSINM